MRISDWSSDVCSSDLLRGEVAIALHPLFVELDVAALAFHRRQREAHRVRAIFLDQLQRIDGVALGFGHLLALGVAHQAVAVDRLERRFAHEVNALRSEEHTSELQSLMRISYAVFFLK